MAGRRTRLRRPDDLRRAYARPLLTRAAGIHDRIQGLEGDR